VRACVCVCVLEERVTSEVSQQMTFCILITAANCYTAFTSTDIHIKGISQNQSQHHAMQCKRQ